MEASQNVLQTIPFFSLIICTFAKCCPLEQLVVQSKQGLSIICLNFLPFCLHTLKEGSPDVAVMLTQPVSSVPSATYQK